MDRSYRESFQDVGVVRQYEHEVFGERSYGELISEIERDYLRKIVARFAEPSAINYLDFACGTARVLSFMENLVGHSRGIEISQHMLDVAAGKVCKAELCCRDISAPYEPIEDQYDLITSFRFFLNAESSLRKDIMNGLAARLKDENSLLVFNVQGILNSYKVLTWLGSRTVSSLKGKPTAFRAFTDSMVRELVAGAGLEIVEIYGYDMLSSKALAAVRFERLFQFERRFAGSRLANRIGGHRLYVVRRRP